MQQIASRLTVRKMSWRLSEPFVISRETITTAEVIVVEIEAGGVRGRGEAARVDYHGIRSIEEYEARARALANHAWLKVKVSADRPFEAVAAVRRGAPTARLIVDANQAWDVRTLYELAPALAQLNVDLLEQPVPADADADLVAGRCAIPICADEAIDTIADLPRKSRHYDFSCGASAPM